MKVEEIRINKIDISSFNTRKNLDAGTEDTGLDDLTISIKEKGLLSPIMVMKSNSGDFELIAGQRRYLAFKKLGLETIPAIIREKLDDTDATILSLIENVHRADMSPIDKARAYSTIYNKYNDFGKTVRETGVSLSTIKKYLSLLNLTPSIQEKLTTAEGPAGIGTLSKLAQSFTQEDQEKAFEQMGGFKQTIQLEMLKQSEGSLEKLSDLKDLAMEGAFDTRICKEGLCFSLPEKWKSEIYKLLEMNNEKEIDAESFIKTIKRLK